MQWNGVGDGNGQRLNAAATGQDHCWLVCTDFSARCLGKPGTPIATLKVGHQRTDPASASAMAGAGKPETVLRAMNIPCTPLTVDGDETALDRVLAWVAGGKPVVLGLRSSRVQG